MLLTILCVLIFPLAVNAVNYVQISKNIESAVFVDNDSISVIRYAPPYYVIQCDERIHSFTMGKWAQITSQYLYDYDNQIIKKRYVSMKARKEDSPWSNPIKYTRIDDVSKKSIQLVDSQLHLQQGVQHVFLSGSTGQVWSQAYITSRTFTQTKRLNSCL